MRRMGELREDGKGILFTNEHLCVWNSVGVPVRMMSSFRCGHNGGELEALRGSQLADCCRIFSAGCQIHGH